MTNFLLSLCGGAMRGPGDPLGGVGGHHELEDGGGGLGWTYFVAIFTLGGAIYGWWLSCAGKGVE
jgi:hypothetical protein